MKKLVIAAMALALSAGVNAQANTAAQASTAPATIGGFTIAALTGVAVSAAVAAAIITNAQNSGLVIPPTTTLPQQPEFGLVCNQGDLAPVAGVCTNNSTTVTVTGTGTATSTITVPVVTTYPAILTRIN